LQIAGVELRSTTDFANPTVAHNYASIFQAVNLFRLTSVYIKRSNVTDPARNEDFPFTLRVSSGTSPSPAAHTLIQSFSHGFGAGPRPWPPLIVCADDPEYWQFNLSVLASINAGRYVSIVVQIGGFTVRKVPVIPTTIPRNTTSTFVIETDYYIGDYPNPGDFVSGMSLPIIAGPTGGPYRVHLPIRCVPP